MTGIAKFPRRDRRAGVGQIARHLLFQRLDRGEFALLAQPGDERDFHRLAFGVYAVRAAVGGKVYGGVASFGVRPTVNSGAPLLEVHLFDFSADIYDQQMEVAFLARLREERKYASLDALKAQMALDLAAARAVAAARPFGDSGQII